MFVLDEQSEVLWANPPAERRLEAGKPFVLADRTLRGVDEATHRELAEALQDGRRARPDEQPPLRWIPHEDAQLAVRVHGAATLDGLTAALPSARIALVAWSPWETPQLDDRVLRELFRLTPREAELALALALGASPRQAATELRISTETARTYLRRIFRKTRVSRQADLVRLVVSNCRPLL